MSLTYLNAAMIEQPASINQLSAANLQTTSLTGVLAIITSLTANNLQIGSIAGVQNIVGNLNITGDINALSGVVYALSGNSTQWNQVFSNVQANSATWEESAEILPTITNYLSTNSVLALNFNTLGTISSGGNNLTNVFVAGSFLAPLTSTWNNTTTTVNAVTGRFSNTSTVVEGASANWNNTTSTLTQLSSDIVNNKTTIASNSSNWQTVYTQFSLVSAQYATEYSLVVANSATWGSGGALFTTVTESSSNWNQAYASANALSSTILNNQTTLALNSATWNIGLSTTTTVAQNSSLWNAGYNNSTIVVQNSSNWDNTYTTFSTNSGNYDNLISVVTQNSATWEESADILPTILTYLSTTNVVVSSLQGIDNNLNIIGNLTVVGSISALSALQITETTFLTGYVTLLSSLQIEGNVTTTSGSFVSGSTNIENIFVSDLTFQPLATRWNNTTTSVNSNSATWNASFVVPNLSTIVRSGSADWNNTYTAVSLNSASWNNVYSAFSPTSAAIISLTTAVQSNSSDKIYIEANDSTNAIKVKQSGSGNAVVIEDSSGTDTTPLIIDTNGRVTIGHTSTIVTANVENEPRTPKVAVLGTSIGTNSLGLYSYATSNNEAANLIFSRGTSNAVGVNGVVSNGSVLGGISWVGDDSESLQTAAAIVGVVDGEVIVGSVPGKISVRTQAVSGAGLIERLSINNRGALLINTVSPVTVTSAGYVGIGTVNPNHALTVGGNISATGIFATIEGTSTNWNNTYTTVQTYSASWEESADILPTVTNYLSTSNVILSGLTTQNITITSSNVFSKTTMANLVSALAITVNGSTLYLPLLSAI
jgi:hypothetical protein